MNFFSAIRKNISLSKTLFIAYTILLLLFYYSFGLLEYYRLNHSQELDSAIHFEKWVSTFANLFSFLFYIAVITLHIVFRNNIKVLIRYLLLNIALFVGMTFINVIISLATPLPYDIFAQPLIIIIILLSIDSLIMWFRNREIS
ncbi:YprA protein [Paenibacillus sp. NAIST15-1]|nr:YprA protein [Paenibacillus sp. NAIST15-1]